MRNITKLYLLFIIILSFVIVGVWFKDGRLISTADEGITFHNPVRTVNVTNNLWVDIGLGMASPFYQARVPYYQFISILFNLGLQNWITQAATFFLLLINPLLFIPKLVQIFIPKKSLIIGYIAALFYVFNFYTESQVFSRFVYVFMFVWSFLPLFLYLWISWIRTGKIKFMVYFLISSYAYSYAFSLPSSLFVFWIPAMIYVLYEVVQRPSKLLFYRSFACFSLWIVVNLWWILPVWSLSNNTYSEMLDSNSSLKSLQDVSRFYDNKDILFLKQKFYFNEGYYHTFSTNKKVFYASNALMVMLVIGIFDSIRKKELLFFSALLLIGWFISKGTNGPFGFEFYDLIFKKLSITQVLRNPYEKFGVLFTLSYSILASYGLYVASRYISKPFSRYFAIFTCLLLVWFLGKPFYNGEVFKGFYHVSVPNYYEDANKYITKNDNGRILHLPFRKFPAIKYKWEYAGEETSHYLFDNPSIFGTTSLKKTDDFLLKLPLMMQNENFPNILDKLDVKYIVLHHDLIQDAYFDNWVDDTRAQIDDWRGVTYINKFGDLDIYEVNGKTNRLIYAATNVGEFNSIDHGLLSLINSNEDDSNTAFFVIGQNKDEIIFKNTSSIPGLKYEKIDSRRYLVSVGNAITPFFLVFSNSYNRNWEAKIGDDLLEKHYMVNGFANAWLVDETGDFEIDIIFKVWPWE